MPTSRTLGGSGTSTRCLPTAGLMKYSFVPDRQPSQVTIAGLDALAAPRQLRTEVFSYACPACDRFYPITAIVPG